MSEKFTFEYIEEYLAGTLPKVEMEAFEKALTNDPELKNLVTEQEQAHQAVALFTQIKTREKVSEIYQEYKKQDNKGKSTFSFRTLAIAASILFLVLMGITSLLMTNRYSSSGLVASNFEPYPDRITNRSDQADRAIFDAINAYQQKDFETAIPLFERIPQSDERYPLARLYLATSRLGNDQADKAIPILENLIATSTEISGAANWYLALAKLQTKDEDGAKVILNDIVAKNGYQAENAKNLLGQLESFWHR